MWHSKLSYNTKIQCNLSLASLMLCRRIVGSRGFYTRCPHQFCKDSSSVFSLTRCSCQQLHLTVKAILGGLLVFHSWYFICEIKFMLLRFLISEMEQSLSQLSLNVVFFLVRIPVTKAFVESVVSYDDSLDWPMELLLCGTCKVKNSS